LHVPSNTQQAPSNSIISTSHNRNRSKKKGSGILVFATGPTDQGGTITTDHFLQLVRGGLTWSTVPGLLLPEDDEEYDYSSSCSNVTTVPAAEHLPAPLPLPTSNTMQLLQQPTAVLSTSCLPEKGVDDMRANNNKALLLSRKLAPPPSSANNNISMRTSGRRRSWKNSTTAASSHAQSSSSPSSPTPCSTFSLVPSSSPASRSSTTNSSNPTTTATRCAKNPSTTNRRDLKDYLSSLQHPSSQHESSLQSSSSSDPLSLGSSKQQLLSKDSSMDDTTASTEEEDESEASTAASPDTDAVQKVETTFQVPYRQQPQHHHHHHLQPLLMLPSTEPAATLNTTDDDVHDDCHFSVLNDIVHDVAHSTAEATGISCSALQEEEEDDNDDDVNDDSESICNSSTSTSTSTSNNIDDDEHLSEGQNIPQRQVQTGEGTTTTTTTASRTLRWADEVRESEDGREMDLETIYSIECLQPISTRVVILLLNPKERLFEFIQCEYSVDDRLTISDLLKQLPGMASIEVLAKQRYTSLCRLDEELINMLPIQDYPVREGEILIAAGPEYRPKMVMAAACALLSQRALLRAVHKAKLSGRALQKLSSSKELAAAKLAAKFGVAKPNNKKEEEDEESEEEEDNNILIVKVLSREYGDSSSPTVAQSTTRRATKPDLCGASPTSCSSSSLELEPELSNGSYDEEFKSSYDEEFLSIPSVESGEFQESDKRAEVDDSVEGDNHQPLHPELQPQQQQQQQRRNDLETQLPADWQACNVLSTLIPTLPLLFRDSHQTTTTQDHDGDDDDSDYSEEMPPESDYHTRSDKNDNHLVVDSDDSYDENTFGYI
jgi:hypothetical protein